MRTPLLTLVATVFTTPAATAQWVWITPPSAPVILNQPAAIPAPVVAGPAVPPPTAGPVAPPPTAATANKPPEPPPRREIVERFYLPRSSANRFYPPSNQSYPADVIRVTREFHYLDDEPVTGKSSTSDKPDAGKSGSPTGSSEGIGDILMRGIKTPDASEAEKNGAKGANGRGAGGEKSGAGASKAPADGSRPDPRAPLAIEVKGTVKSAGGGAPLGEMPLVFIHDRDEGAQKFTDANATTDTAGSFNAKLEAGRWLVYLVRPGAIQTRRKIGNIEVKPTGNLPFDLKD